MQIYALDANGKIITAKNAQRKTFYRCVECRAPVRIRGGKWRKSHFYHPQLRQDCRQGGKSKTHTLIQNNFKQMLQGQSVLLEHPFPEIGRIADVVWLERKIIFEIQCSPISAEEIAARNRDYSSMGYEIVWILHEKTFNRFKLSSAEKLLLNSAHYFTNISPISKGRIYDQYCYIKAGKRLYRSRRLFIDVRSVSFEIKEFPESFPMHRRGWKLSFKGDLYDKRAEINFWRLAPRRKKITPLNILKPLYIFFLEKLTN